MLRIKPFNALRPTPERVSRVASVPYDVVSTAEARELAAGNPESFLHIIRPDIDLPDDVGHYEDVVYETAASAFQRFKDEGVLVREETPCLYLYRVEAELLGRRVSQTGVVACCHIDDYARDIIRKHEKTRQDKEDDRTRHVLTLNANAGPVFLMHKDDDAIAAQSKRIASEDEPLFDFTAPDGVRHTIWRVEASAPFVEAFAKHEAAYVADGHHRSASAARAGAERRAANPKHTGDEEYNWFLTVLFPASELSILPYNRIVRDLNGLAPSDVLARIAESCDVAETNDPEPASTGGCVMYLDGKWRSIRFPDAPAGASPVESLDYVRLYDLVLHPILGIGDIRKDDRIDFVGGIRGTDELKKRVNSGDWAAAFSMAATTIEQLMAVSDAGAIMPPKSTWFEPKLRSGLLVHTIDD